MCNVFSGHIIADKGDRWGEIIFLSGVHHEKDREIIDKDGDVKKLAWESKVPYSLQEFVFTHDGGTNISSKEREELMILLIAWGKKQDKERLLRNMITVIKDNKPINDYLIMDNHIKLGNDMSLICDFSIIASAGYDSTLKAGDDSTLKAGDYSTLKAGDDSTLKAGVNSTLTAGVNSTLTAGYNSTLTAGYDSTLSAGDYSTLKAEDDSTLTAGVNSTLKAGYNSTLTAGYYSTLTAGVNSTLKAGYNSTLTAEDDSTLTAGVNSTLKAGYNSTLKAGYDSTLTAGVNSTLSAGSNSTLTAEDDSTLTAGDDSTCIIYGSVAYIILNGRNVILRQIYYDDVAKKFISRYIELDTLFQNHKVGDKIKIVEGLAVP